MADSLTPEQRSANMARIRGKDTRPEWVVRRLLWGLGVRYRLHRKDLPGTPDLVIPRLRTAVFVHGCYWHRHPGCRRASTPSTRREFWEAKFRANVERDGRKEAALREAGWRVLVVWECETPARLRGTLRRRLIDELELPPADEPAAGP